MTTSAVDRTFSEPLALFFLAKGKADAMRVNLTVEAPLVVGAGASDSPAGRVQSWGSRIASGKARAFIARSTYSGPAIREGDKLRAVNRAGQPWFEVAHVDDRDATRLILHLVEA